VAFTAVDLGTHLLGFSPFSVIDVYTCENLDDETDSLSPPDAGKAMGDSTFNGARTDDEKSAHS
jgi:hypothetical protein